MIFDLSVIVISYNGKEFLRKCLMALSKSSIQPKEVIVVDDCSGDNTEEMIKREFSEVKFVRNQENLGPTASRNKGARLATGNFLLFLDNDVLVRPDTFEKLAGFLDKNSDAGIVGARFVMENGGKMRWNMGYNPNNFRESMGYLFGPLVRIFPKWQGLKNFSMNLVLNYWDYDSAVEVGWVAEGCFAIKKNIFEKLGGFDEIFWMSYEGPDLCYRLHREGLKVYFNPEAKADLLESHTHTKTKRLYLLNKSKWLFYKKHYFYLKSNPILFFIGKIISSIFYLIA